MLALLVCKTESPTLPDFFKLFYTQQTCPFKILFSLFSFERKLNCVSCANVQRQTISEIFLNLPACLKLLIKDAILQKLALTKLKFA